MNLTERRGNFWSGEKTVFGKKKNVEKGFVDLEYIP